MRMYGKVATSIGPCPLCRREVKIDSRGRTWAHKCPHGERCDAQWKLGLKSIPLCPSCKEKSEEKFDA